MVKHLLSPFPLDRYKLKTTPQLASPAKASVATMSSQAYPTPAMAMDSISNEISILGGIVGVYATLAMSHKEAGARDELIVKLTAALVRARKAEVAEADTHPATSLTGANGIGGLVLQPTAPSFPLPCSAQSKAADTAVGQRYRLVQ